MWICERYRDGARLVVAISLLAAVAASCGGSGAQRASTAVATPTPAATTQSHEPRPRPAATTRSHEPRPLPDDGWWSPNGKLVASVSGDFDLVVQSVANGAVVFQTTSHDVANDLDWSPDSRAVVAPPGDLGGPLRIHRLDGRVLQLTAESDREPAWSPDGRWIAFTRARQRCDTGATCLWPADVYLVPSRGGAPRLVRRFAEQPSWSSNGRRLTIWSTVVPTRRTEVVYAVARSGRTEPT